MRDAYHQAGEAVRLADAAGDRQARVWALGTMAMAAPTVREALRIGEEASACHREAGNLRELAQLQTSLAYTALVHADDAVADPLSTDALDAARAYGDPYVLAVAHGNAGLAALFKGRSSAAQHAFADELRLGMVHGFDSSYGMLLHEAINGLAAVAAAQGHDRTTATLIGAVETLTPARHEPVLAGRLDERFFAPARARLGKRQWQQAYAAGARLTGDRAIEIALHTVQVHAVV